MYKNLPLFGNFLDNACLTSCELDVLADFAAANSITATPKQVRSNLRHAREFFLRAGPMDPAKIDAAAVEKYLSLLRSQGKSDKTLLNARGAISRLCSHLVRQKILAANPCAEVKLSKPQETAPTVIPAVDDKAMLAMAKKIGIHAEECCALYAGLRLSEICRLAWADVDFAGKALHVVKSKSKTVRTISLHHRLLSALTEQRRASGHTAWVFPARQTFRGGWRYFHRPVSPKTLGKRLGAIQAAYGEFRRLAGRRVGRGWHLYRHSFATRLVSSGVDVHQVKRWMGHSDIRMTERYLHVAERYNPQIELAGR